MRWKTASCLLLALAVVTLAGGADPLAQCDDIDADGVCDESDTCPTLPNPDQAEPTIRLTGPASDGFDLLQSAFVADERRVAYLEQPSGGGSPRLRVIHLDGTGLIELDPLLPAGSQVVEFTVVPRDSVPDGRRLIASVDQPGECRSLFRLGLDDRPALWIPWCVESPLVVGANGEYAVGDSAWNLIELPTGRQLPTSDESEQFVNFWVRSPKRRLLFSNQVTQPANEAERWATYAISLENGDRRWLAASEDGNEDVWFSQAEDWLVVRDASDQLVLARAQATGSERIHESFGPLSGVPRIAFDAAESHLAVAGNFGGTLSLLSHPLAVGEDPVLLTTTLSDSVDPVFDPTGQQVAFPGLTPSEIYTVPVDGSETPALAGSIPGTLLELRYGTLGNSILARTQTADGVEIYSLPAGGGSPVRLNPAIVTGAGGLVGFDLLDPDSVLLRGDFSVPGRFDAFRVPADGSSSAVAIGTPSPGQSLDRHRVFDAHVLFHATSGPELLTMPLSGLAATAASIDADTSVDSERTEDGERLALFDAISGGIEDRELYAHQYEPDADGDGIAFLCDLCPDDGTSALEDLDGDGIGDACDNCPSDPNPDQTDTDSDGIGDACIQCDDTDGDAICDFADACPVMADDTTRAQRLIATPEMTGANIGSLTPLEGAFTGGLFKRSINNLAQLWSVSLQGGGARRLDAISSSNGYVGTFHASPDGRTALFQAINDDGSNKQAYVVPSAGAAPVALGPLSNAVGPFYGFVRTNRGRAVFSVGADWHIEPTDGSGGQTVPPAPDRRIGFNAASSQLDFLVSAYERTDGGNPRHELSRIDLDTTQVTPLDTSEVSFSKMFVTGDDAWVVWRALRDTAGLRYEVRTLEVATGVISTLAQGPGTLPVAFPRANPESSRFVFGGETDAPAPDYRLSSADLSTGTVTTLFEGDASLRNVWVSPDSQRVVFVDSDRVMRVVDFDGGSLTPLSWPVPPSNWLIRSASFTPSFDALVYIVDGETDNRYELFLSPLDGSPYIKLSPPTAEFLADDFTFDAGGGNVMCSISYGPGEPQRLHRIRLDGSSVEEVAPPATMDFVPQISDFGNGEWLVAGPAIVSLVTGEVIDFASDLDTQGAFVDALGSSVVFFGQRSAAAGSQVFVLPIELDLDEDGIIDVCDNCRGLANDQSDDDGDHVGQACDLCPGAPDPSQLDRDADGFGDACDNCAMAFNPTQADSDLDGWGEACDVCPLDADPMQFDGDGDGAGDVCDCNPSDPSVRPPATIDSLLAEELNPTSALFVWDATAGSQQYSVNRATLSLLDPGEYGACFRQNLVTTSFVDNEIPPSGDGFSYLVQGESLDCGLGSMGPDSEGFIRTNTDPAACP